MTTATESPAAVSVPSAGVRPGMYLLIGMGHRIYVLSRTEGSVGCVFLRAGGAPTEAMVEESRDINAYTSYELAEPDADLIEALSYLLTHRTDPAAAVRAERSTRDTVHAEWVARCERFNRAFWDKVDDGDFEEEAADSLADSHDSVLTPRNCDWDCSFDVSGRVTKTVRAPDEDAAFERAREELGTREGDEYYLASDDNFVVLSISDDEATQA